MSQKVWLCLALCVTFPSKGFDVVDGSDSIFTLPFPPRAAAAPKHEKSQTVTRYDGMVVFILISLRG